MDLRFILGSAAHIERLRSIEKYMEPENRNSMSPHMLEANLFLRENVRFWDAQLVSKAIHMARSERSE